MSSMIKKQLLFASTSIVVACVAGSAFAGGFALREQSAYYQGMSFAGNATTGPSISSIFWNPATITGAKSGLTTESHGTLIMPRGVVKGNYSLGAYKKSVNTGDIASDAFLASSYMAYNVNDKLYLGLSINAPYGLSTKANEYNWAGAAYNRSSKVFSMNITPMIGYKINDMFSVAAGVQFQYLKVRLTNAAAAPVVAGLTRNPALARSTSLEGTSLGVGFVGGVTFRPVKGTEIGLGYRSAIGHDLDGEVYLPVGVPGRMPSGMYDISTSMMTPDTVTLSIKQRLTDELRVLGSLEWTNWSRLKAPKVKLANGAQITKLPFNYNDGFFASLGAEYDVNKSLTLRGGVAYEWSPISTKIRSLRLPDNNRIWVSAGASYNFNENMSFDLGYTHIFGTKTDIKIDPSHQDYSSTKGAFIGTADASVDIIGASFRYKF